MIKGRKAIVIRKSHRYLGLFLGIQFLFWTIGGLYFSWTNLDEIHGDHLKNLDYEPAFFTNLIGLKDLNGESGIQKVQLREINGRPFYWINEEQLFDAATGEIKDGITKGEAEDIANRHMKKHLIIEDIQLIAKVDTHHEYRKKLLPAYVVSYQNQDNVKAYVSKIDGKFQTVRHRNWRWFDFLWMTHTMDYQNRDNFNTLLLRVFSFLGLVTVLSGFVLWSVSSPTLRRFF